MQTNIVAINVRPVTKSEKQKIAQDLQLQVTKLQEKTSSEEEATRNQDKSSLDGPLRERGALRKQKSPKPDRSKVNILYFSLMELYFVLTVWPFLFHIFERSLRKEETHLGSGRPLSALGQFSLDFGASPSRFGV